MVKIRLVIIFIRGNFMEIIDFSKLKTIHDLVNLMGNYDSEIDFQEHVLISINKSYISKINYNYYLLDFKNPVGNGFIIKIKKIIYSNWNIFRHLIRLYHVIRGRKADIYFYQDHKKIFELWETNGLKQNIFDPIISDDLDESKNPILNYFNNIKKLESAYELLSDDESKLVFMGLIKTRLSLNLEFLNDIGSNPKYEYAEEFIVVNKYPSTFIDAGAFDGDSALKIFNSNKNFAKAILIEPNHLNSLKVSQKLYEYVDRYTLLQCGLSSENIITKISLEGVASNVFKTSSHSNKYSVQLVKLDNIIDEEISFLKMDIEGSELEAIMGSRGIIEKYRPILAINVDHRLSDIWQIINYINGLDVKYSFYLRHYLHSRTALYGTILYATEI